MFKIKILTPVHIGSAQEKFWQENIDYISNDHKLYLIDQSKLLDQFSPHDIANALANGTELTSLINKRSIPLDAIAQQQFNLSFNPTGEIKTQIRDGFGRPYIPGSSLKGALRSILIGYQLEAYYNRTELNNYSISTKNNQHKSPNVERVLLDLSIENDIFQSLLVPDISFDQTEIIRTKIFNIYEEKKENFGGWKHSGRGHKATTDIFNPTRFITSYEYLKEEQESRVDIKVKSTNRFSSEKSKYIFQLFNSPSFKEDLIQRIRSKMNRYLDREYNFLYSFYTNETVDFILPVFEKLQEINNQKNSCILRLGAGSGFHSMTGDWKYNFIDKETGKDYAHIAPVDGNQRFEKDRRAPRGNSKKRIPTKLKSRKFAFKKLNQEFHFYPMGFIQLTIA